MTRSRIDFDSLFQSLELLRIALEELLAENRELRLELDGEVAVLAMTVSRLGGLVEGRPTLRLNFLQRVDELREIERKLQGGEW